jgi:Ca2+-binding RTX toxin-like protein
MTFHGSQADINAALASLQYTSTNGHDATLTMTTDDGEGHTDTDHTSIHALTLDADLNLSTDHGSYNNGHTVRLNDNDDFHNDSYTVSNNQSYHVSDGTSGGHTINGLDGDDWLEGGRGDDILNGGDGNDYLDGGSGHDRYDGGSGDDVIKVDSDDLNYNNRSIAGGSGDDVLDLSAVSSWDFRGDTKGDHGHSGIGGIDTLNLSGHDNNNNSSITLDADSVLDMTDNGTLVIKGDGANGSDTTHQDNVTLSGDWNKVGSVTDNGHTYDVYMSSSGGNPVTVAIDHLIHTTTPDHNG